jgi:hypothetical protein
MFSFSFFKYNSDPSSEVGYWNASASGKVRQ